MLGVCTTIGLAGPAYADPDEGGGDDAAFLAALQRAGITYASPDRAIGSGRAVCVCLDNGESGLELIHDVTIRNPGFDMDKAAQFAVISAKHYCPHHLAHV